MNTRSAATAFNLAGGLLCVNVLSLVLSAHRHSVDNIVIASDIELGSVSQRQSCEARTSIENLSSRTLSIVDVRAGCGCTDVDVQSRTIAGYGKADLFCKVQTGRMKGRVSKPITVVWQHEGDESQRRSVVQVNLTVQPDYVVTPPNLEVFRERPSKHDVVIHFNKPRLDKRVVEVLASHSAFTSRILRDTEEMTMIEISFDPGEWGVSNGTKSAISIRLAGVAEETASIPVAVRDD